MDYSRPDGIDMCQCSPIQDCKRAKVPGLLGYEVDCAHYLAPIAARILATSSWVALNDADKHGMAHIPTLRQSRLEATAPS